MRTPMHPGTILKDEIKELGISAAELARNIGVPANRVTQILKGERAISADTAIRLGRWFGTGPELWMNLQTSYELKKAQQEMGSRIKKMVKPRIQGTETQIQAW